MKLYISCAEAQQEWVNKNLIPVLSAAGADLPGSTYGGDRQTGVRSIDDRREQQNATDLTIAVLTPAYLDAANHYTWAELNRAIDDEKILPLMLRDCPLPSGLDGAYAPEGVDLRDLQDSAQWGKLMGLLKFNLGVNPLHWLNVRDEVVRCLERKESVNLVVTKKYLKWRELLAHLQTDHFPEMGMVDLASGATNSREGLVSEILNAAALPTTVPDAPNDLVVLDQKLSKQSFTRVILRSFDIAAKRDQYNMDELYAALRHLVMDTRKLALLIQSKQPFTELLPAEHPLSSITNTKTIELGRSQ